MISRGKVKRLKREAAELNRYSMRRWVVLSLIISLATTAILSKKHLANLWVYAGALIVPALIALYFKDRIVLIGPLAYSAVLIVIIGAAVLYGT